MHTTDDVKKSISKNSYWRMKNKGNKSLNHENNIYDAINAKRKNMIINLRSKSIQNIDVLNAMERIPREEFMLPEFCHNAYLDTALPIEKGQTISQPYIVALMTEMLEPDKRLRVLEIGTGSGYQAAILAKIFHRVFTTEPHSELTKKAQHVFRKLRLNNIYATKAGKELGYKSAAPFDRIIVTAACKEIPKELIEQLKPNGIMVIPIGKASHPQTLLKIFKGEKSNPSEKDDLMVFNGEKLTATKICEVNFVPIIPS